MKEKSISTKRRLTPVKKRSSLCYNKKVEGVTKWYNRLESIRKEPAQVNPNTKQPAKRRELKPLEEYVSKIKK